MLRYPTEAEIPSCKKFGHPRVRTKSGIIACRFCEKIHREKNADKIKKYLKNYNVVNKKRLSKDAKLRYAENREHRKAINREWGLKNKDRVREINRAKRQRQHPDYDIWCGMRKRCRSESSKDYHRYGGRGITVCERWNSFELFVEDMGPRPEPRHNYSIERKDVDGNYEPGNCIWATTAEQGRNKRSSKEYRSNIPNNSPMYVNEELSTLQHFSIVHGIPLQICKYRYALNPLNTDWILDKTCDNRVFEYNGIYYNMPELAILSGKKYSKIAARIKLRNWSVKDAVEIE